MAGEVSPYRPHLKLLIIRIATNQFGPVQRSGVICATKRKQPPARCAAARMTLTDFSCIDG